MAQQHAQSASHGRKGETKGSVDQVNGNDNKGYQPSPDLLSSSAPPRDSVNINHPQPSLEHHYSQHTLPISSLDEDEPESDTDWPELVRRPQYEQETQPVGRSTSASSPAMVLKRSNAVHEGVQHRTSRMPVAAAVQSQENNCEIVEASIDVRDETRRHLRGGDGNTLLIDLAVSKGNIRSYAKSMLGWPRPTTIRTSTVNSMGTGSTSTRATHSTSSNGSASRLQEIHERNSQAKRFSLSQAQHNIKEPAWESLSFPALNKASTSPRKAPSPDKRPRVLPSARKASYAQILVQDTEAVAKSRSFSTEKDSEKTSVETESPIVDIIAEQHASTSAWPSAAEAPIVSNVIPDRKRESRASPNKVSVSHVPTLATQTRADKRHKRAALPDAWTKDNATTPPTPTSNLPKPVTTGRTVRGLSPLKQVSTILTADAHYTSPTTASKLRAALSTATTPTTVRGLRAAKSMGALTQDRSSKVHHLKTKDISQKSDNSGEDLLTHQPRTMYESRPIEGEHASSDKISHAQYTRNRDGMASLLPSDVSVLKDPVGYPPSRVSDRSNTARANVKATRAMQASPPSPTRIPVRALTALGMVQRYDAVHNCTLSLESLSDDDDVFNQNTENTEAKTKRAEILEPIMRRISNPPVSTSVHADTYAPGHKTDAQSDDHLPEQAVDRERQSAHVEDIVRREVGDLRGGLAQDSPRPSKTTMPVTMSLNKASALLLDTIKKSAIDLENRTANSTGPSLTQPSQPSNEYFAPVGQSLLSSASDGQKHVFPEEMDWESTAPNVMSTQRLDSSGLRGNAQPFVPNIEPTSQHQQAEVNLLRDLAHDPNRWIPHEEWATLPGRERFNIMRARGSSSASSTMATGLSMCSEMSPGISPQKRMDSSWYHRFLNGSPVKLGRAPPPLLSQHGISSRDGQAPLQNDDGVKTTSWAIGSAQPGWWYGWRGGDGREISFVGNGPDAEKDPLTPVNFHVYGNTGVNQQQIYPPMVDMSNGFDGYSGPGLLPRGRGQRTFVPCRNYEISDAVEHIGMAQGHCQHCRASS